MSWILSCSVLCRYLLSYHRARMWLTQLNKWLVDVWCSTLENTWDDRTFASLLAGPSLELKYTKKVVNKNRKNRIRASQEITWISNARMSRFVNIKVCFYITWTWKRMVYMYNVYVTALVFPHWDILYTVLYFVTHFGIVTHITVYKDAPRWRMTQSIQGLLHND